MKLSLQSLAFADPRDALKAETWALLAELGYAALEVVPETFNRADASLVRQIAADHGMGVLVGWSLDSEHDPAAIDAGKRHAALAELHRLISLAGIMGATHLGGVLYAGCGRLSGKPPTKGELDRSADTVRAAAGIAASAGVLLCLEPASREDSHLINTAADGMAFLERVGHDNVALQLDTWQMLREECDMASAIASAAGRIGIVHLSESHRGPPGTGMVPWPDVFKALKDIHYDGIAGIETFFDPNGFVAPRAKVWRSLGGTPAEVATAAAKFVRTGLML